MSDHLTVPLYRDSNYGPPNVGDQLIVVIQFLGNPPATPAGWIRVSALDSVVGDRSQFAYARTTMHGDPTSVTFSGFSADSAPKGLTFRVGLIPPAEVIGGSDATP